ncbi:unnamed protein product [Blepharisma stoltei]|uniref:DJ-1/PfpI domain-containing protein n=1 Tax=Blepharisma stoltei TaxID=1481888 RepID=A0AAU9K2N5_9CILI|nr:unnamed protein product [Blepharisma stoltei]
MIRFIKRSMVRVLVAVTNGSEEIELLTPLDLLRRCQAEVVLAASGNSLEVTLGKGVRIIADDLISNVSNQDFDMIVVPGGPGTGNLRDDPILIEMLRRQKQSQKWYAAICAAPALVFETHGLLEGEVGTCYPSCEKQLHNKSRVHDRVVVSNKCITSKGPGTAMEFALKLVEALYGQEKADELSHTIVFR